MFIAIILSSFFLGVYAGYLRWAPHRVMGCMMTRCDKCSGYGQSVGFGNETYDCKSCHGVGYFSKVSLFYVIVGKVLKWTSL